MTRASFTTDISGYVRLKYTDLISGENYTREFMCPENGGYVQEYSRGGWKQVCDRLACGGSTLYAARRAALPALIRREYRAMRREDKRHMNGIGG